MNKIETNTFFEHTVLIDLENYKFRPGAYGIIVNEQNEILLVNTKSNGKLYFPGGGMEVEETLVDCLKREVKEETNIEIDVKEFITVFETFFTPDEVKGYHVLMFFYLCHPLSNDLVTNDIEGEQNKPRWLKIADIDVDNFHHSLKPIVEQIIKYLDSKYV